MRVRRWVQAVLLLFLGLYSLDNLLSGRINFYINSSFTWLAAFGAGLFLLLGILSVINALNETHGTNEHIHEHDHEHHDHEHDHTHEHNHEDAHAGHNHTAVASWPVLGIVAIPLALGILVPAKPLGATAIGTAGVTTSINASASGKTTQLAINPTDRNVLDWVRAFSGSKNVDEFAGQPADVIGFVYRDIRFKDTPQNFMLARFVLSCCVADASAIGVFVEAPNADKYQQDGWLHIKGKFQVKEFDGQRVAVLIPDSVEQIDQPDHPYLYP